MEVNDSTFYVVQTSSEMHILPTQEEAIDNLRGRAEVFTNEDEPDIEVTEVIVNGDDWTVRQLPWQKIAMSLLAEDNK